MFDRVKATTVREPLVFPRQPKRYPLRRCRILARARPAAVSRADSHCGRGLAVAFLLSAPAPTVATSE